MGYNDMKKIQAKILTLNLDEMNTLLDSVHKRYTELAPELELVCFFLPRNDLEERKRILMQSMEFLKRDPNGL